jgi:hypothetical protein
MEEFLPRALVLALQSKQSLLRLVVLSDGTGQAAVVQANLPGFVSRRGAFRGAARSPSAFTPKRGAPQSNPDPVRSDLTGVLGNK